MPHTGSETDTAEVVRRLLAEELRAPVEFEQRLIDLPEIESVKFMRMITRIEDRFDITLDDEAVFAANTVSDLVQVVEAALDGSSTSTP